MESEIAQEIGLILVLGIGLQWLGRRTGIPSIVLLLAGGLAVGPGLGWVEPGKILGDALYPAVSLAVGVLLFQGGLELDLAELRGAARGPVLRLVTIGTLVTWLLTSLAAHLVFREPTRLSVLMGAILVVSGPTVVGPLLRLARPAEPDAAILRWEGILIDPIGATLGLFCLNAFYIDTLSVDEVWSEFVVVVLVGVASGVVAAALLVQAMRNLLIPEDLEVAATLVLVVAAYAVADTVRPEAGLFATTAMGLVLANQRWVPVRHLRAFGEPIVALIIGSLFIVLAAGVDADALADNLLGGIVLAVVLVVVVRPVAVALATAGSELAGRERAFLAAMAPRGIVAASTAGLFSLRLVAIDQPSSVLVPAVFAVIMVVAVVYGLGAPPAARALGVARPPARGALVLSGARWAQGLAGELAAAGLPTLLVARGRADLAGRDLPYQVYTGVVHGLEGSGLLTDVAGAVVASRDDETDLTALSLLSERFGRGHVWVLPSRPIGEGGVDSLAARRQVAVDWVLRPFGEGVSHEVLDSALARGGHVRTVDATDVPTGAWPLVRLHDGGWTASIDGTVVPGDRMIVVEPAADGEAGG